MPARAALVLAGLLATAALAAVWHFRSLAQTESERATATARENAGQRFELKQLRARVDELAGRLAEADTQLGSAKTRATATETRSALLTRELTTARASLSEREQREVALLAQLEELRQQQAVESARPPAESPRPSLPTPPGAPPAAPAPAIEVSAYKQRIAALETQLIAVLARSLAELPAAPVPPAAEPVPEPPPQILQVGARDAFVVINRGSVHGVRPGDVCAFTREGTELALGRLSEVRPRFAIVHLLPGSLKGQLQAGDIAVLAR